MSISKAAAQCLLCAGLSWALPGLVAAPSASSGSGSIRVYVANAENQTVPQVRYTGREWKVSQAGYLEGVAKGHRLLGREAPGEGNFRATWELALPQAGRESVVVLGAAGEIAMKAGASPWELRGRFFRAGSEPVKVAVPPIAPGRQFSFSAERTGASIRLTLDGKEIYAGPCGQEALQSLGVDPGVGVVRLYNFEATGHFASAGDAAKLFNNSFGLQLQPKPTAAAEVWAPVLVQEAPTNECSMVSLRDGTLAIFHVTKPESDSISVTYSKEGGLTWSPSRVAFTIPGRAYYAVKVARAPNGDLHAVFHVLGEGPGGWRGRLYEVYHTVQREGTEVWSAPQRIVPGYVGSIRGMIVLKNGRVVLAVGKAVPGREVAPASGPDFGWNEVVVLFSDDRGVTWRESVDRLSWELTKKFVTRYGAVEPVLVQLGDGRLWMLVRDRGGRLVESFSQDGTRWSPLKPTAFITSDSPAELLRLRDGRLVMLFNACQSWSDPSSYAAGGREVLQAAVSADDGRTWRGFREVLQETNLAGGGDRGTAYPSAAETVEGKVAFVSGQGFGKHAIGMFDPDWLEETSVQDRLEAGPVGWTQYGDEHLRVETDAEGVRAVAIPLKSSGLCGASWNFPMADRGELRLKLWIPEQVEKLTLGLNDHFARVDDRQAGAHAVYRVPVAGARGWTEVVLRWQDARRGGRLTASIGGGPDQVIAANRPAMFGVNYLRIEFASGADVGSLRVAAVSSRIDPR